MSRRTAAALVAACALVTSVATATADSFAPIRMTVHVTPVARAHKPLKTRVTVSADPGVLDVAEGNLWVQVRLARGQCGADFQSTPGVTLVDAPLSPTPRTGQAYAGSVTGSGRPSAFGAQTLCVFLEDADVGRVFANDESGSVTVSRPCTTRAARYDAAVKALRRARRRHRRNHRLIAVRRRVANADRRAARRACGPGVRL